MDLKTGFYNCEVDPATQDLLGIVMQDGLFKYKCMLFGLLATPLHFQYLMDMVIEGLEDTDPFLDDV